MKYFGALLSALSLLYLHSPCPASAQDVSLDVHVVRQNCASRRCPNSAIFFVHGLFGSADTWTNEATGSSFPELIKADPDLVDYDIYSVVYTTKMIGDSPTVANLADALFAKMLPYYQLGHERIVFIAHSLGGNLVRNHVVELKSRFGHHALNRLRLFILLGTPNEGADAGRLGTFVLPNPQIRTLVTLKKNDYLGLLNSVFVKASMKHMAAGCASMRVFAAFERKKTYTQLIVSEQSATRGAFACKGFDADHLELAKPASATSPVYNAVKRLLVGCLSNESGVCTKPTNACDFLGSLFDETAAGSEDFITPSCSKPWVE